ncbi:AmmeMemoRadiSam system protein B [Arcobacter venerupis]|uniref:MEMO1 family protein AVENP_0786 n=1 Tax=Arcobacter venerupis TaxID=1054033 RepID=A0AAE7B777_9BACT|nr:AmmeMemoRadiSam system protein B [Arcobacter venerupis]QKF66346.1 AmmeMemoRadiSam system protein B [Arcobacter venerupis]RWS50874.1 AmmeMemoRadiSam system protein B [Arcobacter venerupis]
MSIRKAVVSGSFYPDKKEEILKYINHFNSVKTNDETFENIKAIIVPHAGYIYSGFTANLAYKLLNKEDIKRVIVIGPSHRAYLKGASVALYDEYETPLGNLKIDKEFSQNLIDKYDFLEFNEECEFEHSTETQAPFIKHYFENIQLVEIVYGEIDYEDLSKVIDEVLEDELNFVVISTDLSHFYTLEEANKKDNICLNAINKKDLEMFNYCEACGKTGVKAIINWAIKNNYETKVLNYCTSADVTKDKNRVVGYTSALIGK